MTTVSTFAPSQRQILVNLGNRYVVFGSTLGLPQPILFDPEIDSELLPRVADEIDIAAERIVQTLRVSGMKKSSAPIGEMKADIELVDDAGNVLLVEIKVRDRDPKQRDYDPGIQQLKEASSIGKKLEIWYFNIERLKLVVMHFDDSGLLRFDELNPLDVWEKTADGIFRRDRVVDEVEDWVNRVDALYDSVRFWLSDQPSLRFEQARTVTMSEEMMQLFAVTDRDIPILDILDADHVIASFVPRGLWLIGAWGRIDVITQTQTRVLVAIRNKEDFEWQLVSPENRRNTEPFDKDVLLKLVKQS